MIVCTFERDVRLHRDLQQPPTTTLATQLRVAHRVRISIRSSTQNRLISTPNQVTTLGDMLLREIRSVSSASHSTKKNMTIREKARSVVK